MGTCQRGGCKHISTFSICLVALKGPNNDGMFPNLYMHLTCVLHSNIAWLKSIDLPRLPLNGKSAHILGSLGSFDPSASLDCAPSYYSLP